MKKKKLSPKAIGLKYGFRSGLEERICDQLTEEEIKFRYEALTLAFIQPSKNRKYTPDFELFKLDGSPLIIETKGRFTLEDRQKMLWVKEQYPGMDIRLLFTNSKQKLSKGAKSTYADWCDKHGYRYADKLIPKEWLREVRR
jgi:hypothetical protein